MQQDGNTSILYHLKKQKILNYKLYSFESYTEFFFDTMLMKRHLLEHERCTFCNSTRENVLHLFWDCTHSQTIWTCSFNAIREKYNITIARNPEYFLFGTYQNDQIPGLGSLILLIKQENWHSQRGPRWRACHYDLDLWPFDPKMYRCLPFPILYLCMKYEVCRLRQFWVIAFITKCGRTDGQTDRQTDGQSDYYRAPASSMAGP